MDYGQLKSNIYDFILTISLNYPDELQQQFNIILADIKNETNASTLSSFISTLTNMVKKYNDNHHSIQFNLLNEELVHLKETHDALQAALLHFEQKGGPCLKDIKVRLQELFDSLSNVIHHQNKVIHDKNNVVHHQNNRIVELESKVTYLLTKSKIDEKRKLIADILIPLSEELHNYLDGLPGKPHRYDDSCIYKAFQEKLANHELNENQYKLFFRKHIDETTYQQFYLFLSNKANELNISLHSLASLLCEKKIRNFTHHSDIMDFLLDSLTTFRYNFVDLMNQHQLAEAFAPEEFNGLKTIFETYFATFIAEARRREQEAANSI
ncbi:unnamed protein product [Rotaria sp. Silwood2]|nr:unnamed protein product [Rotaria sp. Silwood2]CAF3069453.1 unnamed protein product [Rotaria sp. Silwood2]CAF4170923.1 unnamed protein product [Rotaria sp. Silwood2]CAF4299835.1 unnamed protein product [Rotaria sp. Silwood2]CAF4352941.1 unnamed protein product [Rotaria sp. Silwood2]